MREIKFRVWDKIYNFMGEVTAISFEKKYAWFKRGGEYYVKSFNNIEFMRYTGIKNIDGTEIYEGDVLADFDREKFGIVIFERGEYKIKFSNFSQNLYIMVDCYELAGNIYENKEWLEVIK